MSEDRLVQYRELEVWINACARGTAEVQVQPERRFSKEFVEWIDWVSSYKGVLGLGDRITSYLLPGREYVGGNITGDLCILCIVSDDVMNRNSKTMVWLGHDQEFLVRYFVIFKVFAEAELKIVSHHRRNGKEKQKETSRGLP